MNTDHLTLIGAPDGILSKESIQDVVERIEQRAGFGGARAPVAPIPQGDKDQFEGLFPDPEAVREPSFGERVEDILRHTRTIRHVGHEVTINAKEKTKLAHMHDGSLKVIWAVTAFMVELSNMYTMLVEANHVVRIERNMPLVKAITRVIKSYLVLIDLEAEHFVPDKWRDFVTNELTQYTTLVSD